MRGAASLRSGPPRRGRRRADGDAAVHRDTPVISSLTADRIDGAWRPCPVVAYPHDGRRRRPTRASTTTATSPPPTAAPTGPAGAGWSSRRASSWCGGCSTRPTRCAPCSACRGGSPSWDRSPAVDAPAYAADADTMARIVGFHLNRGVLAVADRAPTPSVADAGPRTAAGRARGRERPREPGCAVPQRRRARRRRRAARPPLRRPALPAQRAGLDGTRAAGAVRAAARAVAGRRSTALRPHGRRSDARRPTPCRWPPPGSQGDGSRCCSARRARASPRRRWRGRAPARADPHGDGRRLSQCGYSRRRCVPRGRGTSRLRAGTALRGCG